MTQTKLEQTIKQFRNSHPCVKDFSIEECLIHIALFGQEGNICGLPEDFTVSNYKNLYFDLQNLNDKQIISHFLTIGKQQQRMYGLPEDFNVEEYKKLNPDLKEYADFQAKQHYMKFGRNEYRSYYLDLPEDFSCEGYRKYNPDLVNQTDNWLKQHYTVTGKEEGRLYKIYTPSDFCSLQYKFFNKDLRNLTEEQLKIHYYQFGCLEDRKYKDPLFDKDFFIKYNNIKSYLGYITYCADITQIKSQAVLDFITALSNKNQNCILLVNHMASLQGATHYLYNLYRLAVQLTNQPIYIVDAEFNESLIEKYKVPREHIISYERDSTLLYYICTKLNPCKIYFNSINSQMVDVYSLIDKTNVIFHSHEIKKHFAEFDDKIIPDYVVSEEIKLQYNQDYSIKPFVSREVLPETCLREIDLQTQETIKVNFKNSEAITIGMCGTNNKRKNFNLFLSIATHFPDYNFLWIGGKRTKTESYPSNFIHIEETITPYKYYKNIDYFLLTSEIDPSPYVILENLYVGNKVITFKNSICTDHKNSILSDVYFEYNGPINLNNAINAIVTFVNKTKEKHFAGKEYIKQQYSQFNKNLLFDLLLPKDFCSLKYLQYNNEFKSYTEKEAEWLYVYKNVVNSHVYKLKDLPSDFAPEQYRFFNTDLTNLTDSELELHYVTNGKNENRVYKDEMFDLEYCLQFPTQKPLRSFSESTTNLDLPKSKRQEALIKDIPNKLWDITLVDNTTDITDASQHLHFLYRFFKKNTQKTVCILTPHKNEDKLKKYNIDEGDVFEYLNNSTLLYHYCKKISNKIIFNSNNFAMSHAAKYLPQRDIIYWAHESLAKYQSPVYTYKIVPTLTSIQRDSKIFNIDYLPKHFDELFFLSTQTDTNETSWIKQWIKIKNNYGWINPNKITIGTSGEITNEKNVRIFLSCAKQLPNINFMWIGGKPDPQFKNIPNVYHITQKLSPFSYYSKFDYFLCTDDFAKSYSILENLYLGTPIIAFKENIDVCYNNKGYEKILCLLNGNINEEVLVKFLSTLPDTKPEKNKQKGLEIIKKITSINKNKYESF